MLVCNYFFSLFFSDSFFMGLVVGLMGRFLGLRVLWSGWFCFGRGGFIFFGAVLFYIGVALFTSGWFCLHRGGFIFVGVVLFSSGRQNGDMWHLYDAVLQQIAVMKQ